MHADIAELAFAGEVKLTKEFRIDRMVHVAGLGLATLACCALAIKTIEDGDLVNGICVGAYIVGLTCMLSLSALYNLESIRSPRKALFRRLDHAAIFLMIAGTHTALVPLIDFGIREAALLCAVWVFGLAGIAVKLAKASGVGIASVITYLIMGWAFLINAGQLFSTLPWPATLALVSGCALFSIGTIFIFLERLRFHNAIWHTFVLCACACHFFFVYVYVASS